ncbi:hypothetical protein SPRG_02816 [Saprolegnia parasitica CBS 223.65]|uniref:EF-hand domain-containing protein n=1 Tax=Saprolegnia parasitica (strain CBS 223.65) TaxID=695850 RepID=A0A067CZW0_SAPPC|nr:hypothetical protein SPRG_02816 [Saprolegnia parasitica CBS 223.65]KDO32337.1 hypothetical protein SPRG_02816 [Saprolegnia parasitica CBS 223.65]|eukprot:XP_012196793.1 hypothetical protein SPRG_02816 [Saprolegnia parasitica CBS 223.65]
MTVAHWASKTAPELSAAEAIRVATELLSLATEAVVASGPSTVRPSSAVKKRLPATTTATPAPSIELWLRAETTAANMVSVGAALTLEMAELDRTLNKRLALPYYDAHFMDADLQALHAALGAQTDAYLSDLHDGFRRLRRLVHARDNSLQSLAFTSERYMARHEVEVAIAPCLVSDHVLSPDRIALMLVHCDVRGDGSVDMQRFLTLLETSPPPRERCMQFAFYMLWPRAPVSNSHDERLRIYKLVALLKENHARDVMPAFAATLQWLQSFDEPALTLTEWMRFHRLQSDGMDNDADFVRFLHTTWHVLAMEPVPMTWQRERAMCDTLLQQAADARLAQKAQQRRSGIAHELRDLETRVRGLCGRLREACLSLTRASVSGAVLAADVSAAKTVFDQLHRLEALHITPVLTTLPDAAALSGLIELDIAHLGLWHLPATSVELVHLRILRASHNQLRKESLPNVRVLWPQLRELDLSNNTLTTLPEMCRSWTLLETCNLSSNQLVALSETVVESWRQLRSLQLHDNRLSSLPSTLGCCDALTTLSCHRNALKALPAWLAHLDALVDASFHHNQIAHHSEGPGVPERRHLRQLARCTLSYNSLEGMPFELRDLTKLQSLSLGHNQLRDLGPIDFSCLVVCTEVDLRHNCLRELPSSLFAMPMLQHLFVHANVLNDLPSSIGSAPALASLHAHTNHLSSVPPELSNVATLTHLDLSRNRLSTLPLAWTAFLAHRHPNTTSQLVLETLKLDDNPWENALKDIVVRRSYASPSVQQMTLTLLKLVDYLQRTTTKRSKVDFSVFQKQHKNDTKVYRLRVRKGQAKVATEYLEWAFRDHHQDSGVSEATFRSRLLDLGCPWTAVEWSRVLHRFPLQPGGVDLDRFLEAVERVHDAPVEAHSFPEQVLLYLHDVAAASEKSAAPISKQAMSRATPSPAQVRPAAKSATSVTVNPTPPVETKPQTKKPSTAEARLRHQVLRQRERMVILQQQMLDQRQRPVVDMAREKPNTDGDTAPSQGLVLTCMGETTHTSLVVTSFEMQWTIRELKEHIEAEHGIPTSSQVLLAVYLDRRLRLADAVVLASVLHDTPTPSLQLLVGPPVRAIFAPRAVT